MNFPTEILHYLNGVLNSYDSFYIRLSPTKSFVRLPLFFCRLIVKSSYFPLILNPKICKIKRPLTFMIIGLTHAFLSKIFRLFSCLFCISLLHSYSRCCHNGRRLVPLSEGTFPLYLLKSYYIRNRMKGGMYMSDFEILSIVLMILGIVVTLLLEVIRNTKK